jgi:hypothetical protein
MPMKIISVEYDCEICGTECKTTNHNLRYRKHYKEEHYCQKCIIKLTKCASVFDALPAKYHPQVFDGCIDYELAIKHLSEVRTNLEVSFKCACGSVCRIRWNKLQDRKNSKLESICYVCLQSAINNSEEVLRQHSERSRKLWENQDYRSKCMVGFENHNNRMQKDVEYAHKHKRRSRSVSGVAEISGHNIKFDSGFELIFIDYIWDKCDVLRRCEFPISYGSHYYHPDFYIVYPDGKSVIVEIKGYYRSNVELKQKAADDYIRKTGVADEYVLYDTDRLLQESILTGLGGARMWSQIRKINNVRNITFTEEKHRRIAKVGRSRYYREKEDSENITKALCR